jgi:hypothetical protein
MLHADVANHAGLPSMSVAPIHVGEALGGKTQRRRKYVFTTQIDQRIREIYLHHPYAKSRPGIPKLADQVGIPHWALKKRARELGLARTKEKAWSEPELAILARYAWMSDERIRLKLKAAGYARTVTGIHLKVRRMRFKSDPSFYSGKGLADALGIDSHVVTRWIKAGHLRHSCEEPSGPNSRAGTPISSARKTCGALSSSIPPRLTCARSISCGF